MLGVDRCCKRQTVFKSHRSQTECLERLKTPGRRSGTPCTSALGPTGSSFGPSSLARYVTSQLGQLSLASLRGRLIEYTDTLIATLRLCQGGSRKCKSLKVT